MDESDDKKRQDFLRELYLSAYDKATGFMVLVISAGYAGAFTLWDKVQPYLTYRERMTVGAFFTASLLLFVGWQVRGQWIMSRQQLRVSQVLSASLADIDAVRERFRVDQLKIRSGFQRQVPWVFGTTVTLAGIGAIVLLVACVRHLLIGHV
jgi:hypothetical protein